MQLIENETKHRQALEKKQLDTEIADGRADRIEKKRGQLCGLTIGLAAVLGGAVSGILGAQWAGAIIGGTGVVGLVSVFVLGRVLTTPDEEPTDDT